MKVTLEMTQEEILAACRNWLEANHPELYDSNAALYLHVEAFEPPGSVTPRYLVSASVQYLTSES